VWRRSRARAGPNCSRRCAEFLPLTSSGIANSDPARPDKAREDRARPHSNDLNTDRGLVNDVLHRAWLLAPLAPGCGSASWGKALNPALHGSDRHSYSTAALTVSNHAGRLIHFRALRARSRAQRTPTQGASRKSHLVALGAGPCRCGAITKNPAPLHDGPEMSSHLHRRLRCEACDEQGLAEIDARKAFRYAHMSRDTVTRCFSVRSLRQIPRPYLCIKAHGDRTPSSKSRLLWDL